MERKAVSNEKDLNFDATELRLGLPGTKSNKRPFSDISKPKESSDVSDAGNDRDLDDAQQPPSKAQVVGWPPIRSYRKNCLAAKKSEKENSSGGMYVKVSMDGVPFLRKIDLTVYKSYGDLMKALENMFKISIGFNGSDFAPTYEDKDGDWMLVGDVPLEMFISSCKRLRIMKGSEARGLGCL